jgi:hypothetical protein
MLSRLFRLATLAAVLLTAPVASAAPDKKDSADAKGPAVLVRVQSINDLLKTGEYIRTLLPEEFAEQVKQGIDTFKAFIDDKKGFEGIDVKNPIGLYVTFGEELGPTPPVVVLIPVADEDSVLNALKTRLNLEVEKEKDGVYKTQPPQSPFPVYFRFANGYAYVTLQDAANIDPKTLAKPETVLGGRPEHLISATVRIDRLPKDMKNLAVAGIETQLSAGKEQPIPNATKAIKEFRDKAIDELTANIKELLDGGEEAALRLNVDPKAQEIALELELSGAKGTKLAQDIRSIREHKSVVGGALAHPDAAMSVTLSARLAENLRKDFPTVVDDVQAELLKQAPIPGDILTKAEPLLKALLPTVKAGELDVGVALIGPDKNDKYTAVAGLKLSEGKKLEGAIKEAVKKELPPEVSGMVQLDAEKLDGGASLHVVKLADQLDADAQKVFGKSDVYLTFRDDLLVVAVGPDAKGVLKKAVASKPADVGILHAQVSLARVVPIMGDNAQELATARKAAEKVFGKGTGSKADALRFSIDGGDSLKVKIAIQGKAIQFLVEAAAGKKDQ